MKVHSSEEEGQNHCTRAVFVVVESVNQQIRSFEVVRNADGITADRCLVNGGWVRVGVATVATLDGVVRQGPTEETG